MWHNTLQPVWIYSTGFSFSKLRTFDSSRDIIIIMKIVQIFWFYFFWHYTLAWKDFLRVVNNVLWFIANYFSIALLGKTLFSPWRRLVEHGGKGTGQSYLAAFILNFISRFIGFLVRSVTISFGMLSLALTIFIGIILAFAWLILPLIIPVLLFSGIFKLANIL